MSLSVRTSTWNELASEDNALAVATRAAEADTIHCATGFKASFSASALGRLLQVKDGVTVIDEVYVYDVAGFVYASPLRGTPGNAMSVELQASGVGGVIGKVSLMGYSQSKGF